MGCWKLLKYSIRKMKQRPDYCILFFIILCGVLYLWSGALGTDSTRPAKRPTSLFKLSDMVLEITSGSLAHRDFLLKLSEVSFVLYYAPWCRSSMLAVAELKKVAKLMKDDIGFIAINCWWSCGECREKLKPSLFPQLFLYHPDSTNPIEYKGPHNSTYFMDFLERSLNPLVYLGTSNSVNTFLNNGQLSVIQYFTTPLSPLLFRKYMEFALLTLKHFPTLAVNFGVVLGEKLSSELGLNPKVLYLYDRTMSVHHPASRLVMERNTTAKNVTGWLKRRKRALKRIIFRYRKSNDLYRALKDGPTLMAFFMDFDQLRLIEDIAIRYNKQASLGCCQSLLSNTGNICLKNTKDVESSSSCALFRELLAHVPTNERPPFIPLKGGCGEWRPFYDWERSRFEICWNPTSPDSRANRSTGSSHVMMIDGLMNETNMTLKFLALDHSMTSDLTHSLGYSYLNQNLPNILIVDLHNEHIYVMEKAYTADNIEQFILNYINHLLVPIRSDFYLLQKEQELKDAGDVSIPHIFPQHFESRILTSTRDVLVYYHANWCGGCMECSHALLALRMSLPNVDNLLLYQVDGRSNEHLPLAFKAPSYPAIVLFPGRRTNDSVVFSSPCSFDNIVEFLLTSSTIITKAQILLQLCDRYQAGSSKDEYPLICSQRHIIKKYAR